MLEAKTIAPIYADDEGVDSPARCNAHIIKVLIEQGPDRGYFPEPGKSIHICDDPSQVQETKQIFQEEGIREMTFTNGQRYVGGFIGTEETRLDWVRPQVEQWA
eukprot:8998967-Ditylum_brightwellii.AAC.1